MFNITLLHTPESVFQFQESTGEHQLELDQLRTLGSYTSPCPLPAGEAGETGLATRVHPAGLTQAWEPGPPGV